MDLIEVLWKQDVDLGFTLVEPTVVVKKACTSEKETEDDIEKLKALETINAGNEKVCKILSRVDGPVTVTILRNFVQLPQKSFNLKRKLFQIGA